MLVFANPEPINLNVPCSEKDFLVPDINVLKCGIV
jgi:hypothetical protein